MRLIFAGTPAFAAEALAALHSAGHEVVLVLTRPDRAVGRGLHLASSETAEVAQRLNLRIEKPMTLGDAGILEELRRANADLMVVAAYGQLLPQAVLETPAKGCLNIHGSLLPRWRGAAPIQRAIEAGDTETGISIMQMDAGLDSGPVLLYRKIPINADDTSATMFQKMSTLGASSIVSALEQLPALQPMLQDSSGITYARKLQRSEAPINWALPANEIERRMRAFDPFPGCETRLNGETLKVWRAEVMASADGSSSESPGTVLEAAPDVLRVRCGEGDLSLKIVQRPGGRRLPIAEFLRGTKIEVGAVFK